MSSASDGRPAKKVTHTEAARILAARDPVIARMVAETGLPRFSRPQETHFATLVRAIVYQQLAGSAAAAIHGRLIMSFSPCLRMWNRSFSGFESRSFTSFG